MKGYCPGCDDFIADSQNCPACGWVEKPTEEIKKKKLEPPPSKPLSFDENISNFQEVRKALDQGPDAVKDLAHEFERKKVEDAL